MPAFGNWYTCAQIPGDKNHESRELGTTNEHESLTRIQDVIERSTRQVVISHPNAYNCRLYRREVQRQAPCEVGGMPTLGGTGVMSVADEAEIAWNFLGLGYALLVERGDAPSDAADELRFLIEPEIPIGETVGVNRVVPLDNFMIYKDIIRLDRPD